MILYVPVLLLETKGFSDDVCPFRVSTNIILLDTHLRVSRGSRKRGREV